jgi:Mn2+/Fe2+ NRAMP family transporter
LNANGVTDIQTSAQAAEALRPVAGVFTFALFAAGIMATGMLAVPVLAGSAAYGVSEVFGWTEGLDHRPKEAKAFYATIAVATLGGVALNFRRSIRQGAVLERRRQRRAGSPLMAVMMVIAMNRRIMGRLILPRPMLVVGWLATIIMALASVAFFAIWLIPGTEPERAIPAVFGGARSTKIKFRPWNTNAVLQLGGGATT